MVYSVANRLNYIGKRVNQTRGELGKYTRPGSTQKGNIREDSWTFLFLTPGHTDVQDLIPQTVVTQIRYVDFILTAADLNLPGIGLTTPQQGDLIEWQGNTYTVTAPTATDDVWLPTTMYRDRIRVHTTLTAVGNGNSPA